MAYDYQRGGRGCGQQAGGYNNRSYGQQGGWNNRANVANDPPEPVKPKKLPVNYVDEAERVIGELKAKSGRLEITTSKIRAIHALVADIYNAENPRSEAELLEESQLKLMRLRVRIIYDGREKAVREFVEKAQLLEYIKGIGKSRAEMIQFAHYMEALVAYHCYYSDRKTGQGERLCTEKL